MLRVNRLPGALALAAGLIGAALHAVNSAAGRSVEPSFWLLSAGAARGYGLLSLALHDRATGPLRLTVAGVGLLFGGSLLVSEWSLVSPGAHWTVWVSSWTWAPAYVALVGLLPSLLPDGDAPPSPWRWTPWAGLAAVVTTAAWWALLPYEEQDYTTPLADYSNPVGTPLAATLPAEVLTTAVMLVAISGAVGAQVSRWRRAAGVARQQLKWVLLGVSTTLLLLLVARLLPVPLAETVAGLAMLPLPAAVAVAVLRHGLWDVDVVVSRALGYAGVAALAAGGYAAAFLLVGLLVEGSALTVSVLAVAVIAPALLPAHAALQRRVNRWVHGFDDEPWDELSRLGDALAAAAHPDELVGEVLPDVVVRTRRALRASRVRLRLQDGSTLEDVVGSSGPVDGPAEVVPLEYGGERLGELEVTRAGGFGRTERVLLDRLAGQAAVAVHTVVLVRESRRAREAVVLAREEERRRLRSDLHDGVGPSVAALALQVETARDLVADDPEATAALLSRLAPRINAVVADVRSLVHELRPPTLDELGLPAAVRELAARLSGTTTRVVVDVGELGDLPAAVEVAAYRIMGEAAANAVRHAGAATVRVLLDRRDGELVLEVRDDGRGLAAAVGGPRTGVGLASMRSRCEELGGRFALASGPAGTTVTARMPLTATLEPR